MVERVGRAGRRGWCKMPCGSRARCLNASVNAEVRNTVCSPCRPTVFATRVATTRLRPQAHMRTQRHRASLTPTRAYHRYFFISVLDADFSCFVEIIFKLIRHFCQNFFFAQGDICCVFSSSCFAHVDKNIHVIRSPSVKRYKHSFRLTHNLLEQTLAKIEKRYFVFSSG